MIGELASPEMPISDVTRWSSASTSSRMPLALVRRAPYHGGMTEPLATSETRALRALLEAHSDEFHELLSKYSAVNPRLFGSVARGEAHAGSDIDILVEMDPAEGNLLMRASGLMEETRQLLGRDDVDVFPIQLLKEPVSRRALAEAVGL